MPFGIVRLDSSFSLIMGHKPESLSLDKIGEKMILEKRDVESFGLFDSAQPNFHTYYPGVKPEDLKPQDAEFIYPVFRALSEVIVRKQFDPIDFSEPGVLKASMHLLNHQTVYPNHEMMIGNELGVISDTTWQTGYKTEKGISVPAGINATFKIDGKAHPKIARGILMDPPSIHSNSVTVNFKWEKSHPKLSDNDFWSMVGKKGSDGKLVRRVVTEIQRYFETSLVAHGADPYAQKVDSKGNIVNPVFAHSRDNLSENKPQVYFFDYKSNEESLSEEPPLKTQTDNKEMKDLILLTLAAFAIKTDGLSDEQLMDEYKKLNLAEVAKAPAKVTELQTKLTDANTKLADVETKLTEANGKVTTLEASNTALNASVTEKVNAIRANVIRMYNVLNKKPDQAILNTFAASDEKALVGFQTEYQRMMDEKFPAECKKCGSHDVARNSAMTEAPAEEGGGGGNPKKSHGQLVDKFTKRGAQGASGLHKS